MTESLVKIKDLEVVYTTKKNIFGGVKTDVAHQIVGELGQNDFSLMNFVIPLRAKHKDEALKFALFLTNDKNQLELAKMTNVLTVNDKTFLSIVKL